MSDIAVRVDNLGKRYRLGELVSLRNTRLGEEFTRSMGRLLRGRSGQDAIPPPEVRGPAADFWALRDVSFEVRFGEVLGIVGRNGAGKSTLLKIISRITAPTEGRAEIRGRLGSLLEVGIGFHPDLSGRENIYLNGAIMGLSRREVKKRFDEIVDFADIDGFIDTPVKRYSSGMYMRLAFAVAAHLDSEILIVDEVLAVGDAAFQRKCTRLMRDVRSEGRAILFVSHSMAAVQGLCTRGLVLEHGRVALCGSTDEVLRRYFNITMEVERREEEEELQKQRAREQEKREKELENQKEQLAQDGGEEPRAQEPPPPPPEEEKTTSPKAPFRRRRDRLGDQKIRLLDIEVRGEDGGLLPSVRVGQNIELHFLYETDPGVVVEDLLVGFNFRTELDLPAMHHNNALTGQDFGPLTGRGRFVCAIPKLPLLPGAYLISYALMPDRGVGGRYHDCINLARELIVEPGEFYPTGLLPMSTHAALATEGSWTALSAQEAVAAP